ncbi:MAG: hypothetical protein E3K36_10230 [Candidatus Brocadia sp.]|nr:hypothetical protein [Candidatus Brocadia sp.]
MSNTNKILACIQILIFLSHTLCGSGINFNVSVKSGEFPCKDHECGCKSASDCRTNCCCSPQGNYAKSHHDAKKQKNGFQSFISSLMCKSGSDGISVINTELKYVLEDDFVIPQIAFLYFLASDIMVHICEPMVSPPEKPPRCPV